MSTIPSVIAAIPIVAAALAYAACTCLRSRMPDKEAPWELFPAIWVLAMAVVALGALGCYAVAARLA